MPYGSKSTPEENARYIKGLCRTCGEKDYRAGGTECEECYRKRVGAQWG